jgi:hypothetical protein
MLILLGCQQNFLPPRHKDTKDYNIVLLIHRLPGLNERRVMSRPLVLAGSNFALDTC